MTADGSPVYTSIPAQYGRLVSVSLPCENVTLAQFLALGRGGERYYWESSRDDIAFAGLGTALELQAYGADRFEDIRHHAVELFADAIVQDSGQPLTGPRLFGGFSFRAEFVPDVAWSNFTPAHFVLPHFQLTRLGDAFYLTINAHVPFGENPLILQPDLEEALHARIAEIQAADDDPLPPLQHSKLSYPMEYAVWERNLSDAIQRMRSGELQKVVLSRVAEVEFPRRFYADNALRYLTEQYPGTYRFVFEPRAGHAFFGATPELLVSTAGDRFETMALAGSMKRGTTPEEDRALAQALLDSEKNRYEHQLVVDGIREQLSDQVAEMTIAETQIMTLSNIHHLLTPIAGQMKKRDGVLPLVDALHPTPALGGQPRDVAMRLIGEAETVPRGWYAAPVGWLDQHLDGQFGVAIRSAVAQERRVWLYAGAGIVADSDPQAEWDETALKFRPMLGALGVSDK